MAVKASKLAFNDSALKKAEDDFNAWKMQMDPLQYRIVKSLAKIASIHVNMDEKPLRGFVYLTYANGK